MKMKYSDLLKLNPNLDKDEIKIGKKGLYDNIIKEIIKKVYIKKAVKIRLLKNSPLSLAELINRLNRIMIENNHNFKISFIRGKTFIIFKEPDNLKKLDK